MPQNTEQVLSVVQVFNIPSIYDFYIGNGLIYCHEYVI